LTDSERPNPAALDAAEKRILQYVVDNIPYLIFWKDAESRYLGCNKNFAALDGRADPRELVGRSDADMVWKDQAETYRAGDVATMQAGVPILNQEEVSPDGKGGEMVILTSKVPLRDDSGAVNGLLGIIVDITERKRLELDLKRAKEEAEQAVRARNEFIANVTHELRTPLTLILGPVVEALGDPSLSAAMRRLLERVQRNGFRLYNLVNDVLDLSKAEAGQTRASRERTDVRSVLAALLADMQPLAQARGLTLELSSDEAELPVMLDVKLFERIVLNLVGNALKFTAQNGWVRVSLAREATTFRVDVADNGAGIDAATQARLFQKFVQADGSATRKHEGTGLGLALVKHFTDALGGSVAVSSEVGKGATFSVTLPLDAARTGPEEPAAEAADTALGTRAFQRQVAAATRVSRPPSLSPPATRFSHPPSLAPDASGPKPRVLLVEDNADLRAYMSETLKSDFSTVGVSNGKEAWELLQSQRFDVVCSDVMMPVLDGISLTRRIKEHPVLSSLPVILLSARGGSDAAASGLDAGADDYVPKPFAANELRARVRAAYRMKRLQEQLREQSRAAGIAEVATGIVHNVGNVLNSVGISAGLVRDCAENSAVALLTRLAASLNTPEAQADLARFFQHDPAGKSFSKALAVVSERLVAERETQVEECNAITECIAHVREIVSSQQGLTRGTFAREATDVNGVLDKALLLTTSLMRGASVEIERDFQILPVLWIDPHILLQSFINVLNNARQALAGNPPDRRKLTLLTRVNAGQVEISFVDNGEGIAPRHLQRIFHQGFTTRPQGLGFGLHMSSMNLRTIGGSIRAHSDGPGAGATFVISLPVETQASAAE
jgi:two-component system, sensor histidine kinase ChiS